MLNAIKSFIPSVAKAIVAGLMPVILVGVAWVADNVGLTVDVDANVLEVAVVSVLTAVATYIWPNTPAD